MTEFGLILIGGALLLALLEWHWGVLLIAVAGIAQEVVRKVVPGEPVAVVLLAGAVFAAALLGLAMRRGGLGFSGLLATFGGLRRPLLLLFLWLTLQHLATLVRFRNLPLLGIGVISYFFPLLAIALGFSFGRSEAVPARPVSRYLLLYVGLVCLASSGILLDFLGVQSPLLNQVGEGIVLYDETGIVRALCGFFRSSEIAAWHIGAALCLLLTLASVPGRRSLRLAAVLLAPYLLTMAVLTGRRKVLMVVTLFVSISSFLLARARQGRRSAYPALVLAVGIAAGLYIGNFFDLSSPRDKMGSYLRRGGTVFVDAPQRFSLLGVQSIWWAINDFGLFGVGAGVLGQGGQHFGAGGEVFGGSGEGGLGKITGELGVPGLLLLVWIGALVARHAARLLTQAGAAGADPERRALTIGLMALLAANVPSFIVASQAYGDPFIILSLGLFAGFAAALGEPAAPVAPVVVDEPPPRTHLPPRPWGRV